MRSRDPAVKFTDISIVSQRKHRGRKDSFADCLLISELSQDKQGGSEYHSLSKVTACFFQLNKTGGSITVQTFAAGGKFYSRRLSNAQAG